MLKLSRVVAGGDAWERLSSGSVREKEGGLDSLRGWFPREDDLSTWVREFHTEGSKSDWIPVCLPEGLHGVYSKGLQKSRALGQTQGVQVDQEVVGDVGRNAELFCSRECSGR